MRYTHTFERSVELLREALPLMSRQQAALHPTSYAVWYAYVAGDPSALREAVDGRLRRHHVLDEAATQALYEDHLADDDTVGANRIADGFRRVLTGMSDTASAASEHTTRFGDSLSRISAGALDAAALSDLREHTRQMQHSIAHLQQRLDASRREVDWLREEVEQARRDALVDALTGLANRRAFDRKMAALIAGLEVDAAAPRPCLLIGDIDNFKRINDRYGHQFGDQVLRGLAEVIRTLTPTSALAARVGGEEFALLLPGAMVDDAERLAERLRAAVASSRIRQQQEGACANDELGQVTVSLGVAPYRHGETAHDFFQRADRALYRSKTSGRNRVTLSA